MIYPNLIDLDEAGEEMQDLRLSMPSRAYIVLHTEYIPLLNRNVNG